MAKYNLLEDDDIFKEDDDIFGREEKKEKKDQESAKQEEEFQEEKRSVEEDEDLLDITSVEDEELLSEDEAHEEPDDLLADEEETFEPEIEDFEDEEDESFSEELDTFEKTAAPSFTEVEPETHREEKQPGPETEEYQDEKQDSPNYKPILIAAIALVVLVSAYFAIDYFFLGNGEEQQAQTEQTDEQALTAEQQQQQQLLQQKRAFLGSLNSRSQQTQASVGNVLSLLNNNSARLSILHIYGDEFLFEVYGDDRADLARFNMAIKDKMSVEVVSSTDRPGNGILNVFKGNLAGAGGSSASAQNPELRFSTIKEAEDWLKSISQSRGAQLRGLENQYITKQNEFQKFHVTGQFVGSLSACQALINQISGEGVHFSIYKMSLSSTNQSTYKDANYRLSFVLEVFV